MIVEELIARLGFEVTGEEELNKAAVALKKVENPLKKLNHTTKTTFVGGALGNIRDFARRLRELASTVVVAGLARLRQGLLLTAAAFRTLRIASLMGGGALGGIGIVAALATRKLATLAATFAKTRVAMINAARVGGLHVGQMHLMQTAYRLLGADVKNAVGDVTKFNEKVREGAQEGNDFSKALAGQGIKLKDTRGQVKSWSLIADEATKALDKITDPTKRTDFVNAVFGDFPTELRAKLLQAGSAFQAWRQTLTDAKNIAPELKLSDILDAQDVAAASAKWEAAGIALKDSFLTGLTTGMAPFLRETVNSLVDGPEFQKLKAGLRSIGEAIGPGVVGVWQGIATSITEISAAVQFLLVPLQAVETAMNRVLSVAQGINEALKNMFAGEEYTDQMRQQSLEAGIKRKRAEIDALPPDQVNQRAAKKRILEALERRRDELLAPTRQHAVDPDRMVRQPSSAASPRADAEPSWLQSVISSFNGAVFGREAGPPIAAAVKEALGRPGVKDLAVGVQGAQRDVSPAGAAEKVAGDTVTNNETTNEYDQRQFSDIGNDKRTISVSVSQSISGVAGVAQAAASAVLGAISTKGANTSTDALATP